MKVEKSEAKASNQPPKYSNLKVPSFLSGEESPKSSPDPFQSRLEDERLTLGAPTLSERLHEIGSRINLPKFFLICFVAAGWILGGRLLFNEWKTAKIETERKAQYDAEVRRKSEEAAFDARFKAHRVEIESKTNSEIAASQSTGSMYQTTNPTFQPAMGSVLRKGTHLYHKTTKNYVGNILFITKDGDVVIADLQNPEFKPDRVSVYGVTFSRSYVKENFVTK